MSEEPKEYQAPKAPDLSGLDPEVTGYINSLVGDNSKLYGTVKAVRSERDDATKGFKEATFTALQTQHAWLKPEMLEGVGVEKWGERVALFAGIPGATSSVTAPGTPGATSPVAPATTPVAPQLTPPTPVISDAAAAEVKKFFEGLGGAGATPPSQGPIDRATMDKRVADGSLTKAQAAEMWRQGMITDMPYNATPIVNSR